MPGWVIPVILTAVMILIMFLLYRQGKKMQEQQAEQQKQVEANAQQVTLLIIDKKRMRLKDAGMPDAVIKATPWYTKRAKLPVVKVKVGPKIMNLICNEEIFDELPTKKEVKATVSGLYLTAYRGAHGRIAAEPVKKSFRARLTGWIRKNQENA